MTGGRVELSVVIPAFNEQARIRASLGKVLAWLSDEGRSAEVIVVDDGSTDSTPRHVERTADPRLVLLKHESNQGKGASLRTGVAASRGERVLLCDADLSAPIEEVEKLERVLSRTVPIVYGSRHGEGAVLDRKQPMYRQVMGWTFSLLTRALGLTSLRDTQCGFKLLAGDVARQLFALLETERFAFDVELLALAKRFGYEAREVGVIWRDSQDSTVRLIRDPLEMFVAILRVYWRMRRDFER